MPLSRNLGTLTSWNPLGHSRPVTGLLIYMQTNLNFTYSFKRLIRHDYSSILSSYRAVNTVRLGYKNQSVNVVQVNNLFFSQIRTKHINTLCEQGVEFVNVKPHVV